jgi:hypothetical protein
VRNPEDFPARGDPATAGASCLCRYGRRCAVTGGPGLGPAIYGVAILSAASGRANAAGNRLAGAPEARFAGSGVRAVPGDRRGSIHAGLCTRTAKRVHVGLSRFPDEAERAEYARSDGGTATCRGGAKPAQLEHQCPGRAGACFRGRSSTGTGAIATTTTTTRSTSVTLHLLPPLAASNDAGGGGGGGRATRQHALRFVQTQIALMRPWGPG